MKKILFYTPFIKTGGLEKVSIEYLKGLQQMGCEVDLLIDFDMGGGNTMEQDIPLGIKYSFVKSKNVSRFIYFFRTTGKKIKVFNLFLYGFMLFFDFYYFHFKVKKILKQNNYDYTISFYQFLPAYITSVKNMKHFIWLHGTVEDFFEGITILFKKSYGRKLGKYNYICTITDKMKEQLLEFYPQLNQKKVKRFYNPFDISLVKDKSGKIDALTEEEMELIQQEYICTVARIDENYKDIKTLILAYEKLYKVGCIKHNLYIVGDGPDLLLLKKKVKEKGLSHRIYFLGNKQNPYVWMNNAELFILSSKSEGFGLVLVEAMICNTFVISSKCKYGPEEILINGKCGDLFPVGDADELARLIQSNLFSFFWREEKMKQANKRVLEFSKENIFAELKELLV